jgi:hypothetical protein
MQDLPGCEALGMHIEAMPYMISASMWLWIQSMEFVENDSEYLKKQGALPIVQNLIEKPLGSFRIVAEIALSCSLPVLLGCEPLKANNTN